MTTVPRNAAAYAVLLAMLVLVEAAALYTHNTAVIMLAGLNGMALLA